MTRPIDWNVPSTRGILARVRQIVQLGAIAACVHVAACSNDPDPTLNGNTTAGAAGNCLAPTVLCGSSCVDLGSDPTNCGACGTACLAGQLCQSGACTQNCVAPQVDCGGTCADPSANTLHCGACNQPCGAGQICQSGTCVTGSCAAGQTLCGGACTDTTSDVLNCGGCGAACLAGQSCQGGVCSQLSCPTGQASCNGVCTDVTSTQNCGGCGLACTTGQTCQNGSCVGSSTDGLASTTTSTTAGTTTGTTTGASTSSTGVGGSSTSGSTTVGTTTTGTTGAGGATSTTEATTESSTTGGGGDCTDTGAHADMSFFVTSYYHIVELSGSDNGFGGDLRYNGAATGLEGADAICQEIANRVCFGHRTWRAYLSTSTVNAIDRIGTGPWYDYSGALVSNDTAGLLSGDRPAGGANDNGTFDELGTFHDGNTDVNNDGQDDDDHDTMTATLEDGTYAGFSCNDWTSTTATDNSGGGRNSGIVMGHSWPANSGQHWAQSHGGHQCAAGVNFIQDGAGDSSTVGGGGGYGGFYCFALAQ